MADVWHEYTPLETPTGDVWVNANVPVGDEWFDVHNDFTTKDIAWHIQNGFNEEAAWHIQNQFVEEIAWNIFERIIKYIALFRLQPLKSTYKLNALTSSFSINELQSAFTLLEDLISTYNLEVPLISAFTATQLNQAFDIDTEVHTAKSIQKNESGTMSPYE
jgi:hypothetical protein